MDTEEGYGQDINLKTCKCLNLHTHRKSARIICYFWVLSMHLGTDLSRTLFPKSFSHIIVIVARILYHGRHLDFQLTVTNLNGIVQVIKVHGLSILTVAGLQIRQH